MTDTERAAATALADVVPRLARMIASTLQNDPEVLLTLRQYRMLERLRQRSHRITELASSSDISQPTATTAIDSLESRQLVRRRRDPADGRATLIEITRSGEAAYDRAHQVVVDRLVLVASGLELESVELIERVTSALAEGLDRLKRIGSDTDTTT